jgi:superfamily I DNA/RNA helicase
VSRITIFADAAQSIYRSGFRWKQAELNPRGRQLQRIAQNHRNTVQVWEMATSFLEAGSGPDEPDAYVTAKRPTAMGDLPLLLTCPDAQTQVAEVIARIQKQLDAGVSPQTIGVLAGRRKQTELLVQALREAHIPTQTDDNNGRIDITHLSVKALTMHSAKGLDFPHVYLVGLTEGGIPGVPPETSADELEDDHAELQRRLLYTAMIRAGRTLTMTTVTGRMHPLVKDIRDDVCARVSVGVSSPDTEQ